MTMLEALRAGGPDGTMSGCSKVRTMQVIHEPQRTSHGSDISRDGRFAFDVLIRSALLHILEIA